MGPTVWARMQSAMSDRGWMTTSDRTAAWHLARGGVPVVFVDFSADNDDTKGPYYGYDLMVTVGLVRAKHGTEPCTVTVESLLPTREQVRLHREGAEWPSIVVEHEQATWELPLVNGGRVERPLVTNAEGGKSIDVDAVADMVAVALAPGHPKRLAVDETVGA